MLDAMVMVCKRFERTSLRAPSSYNPLAKRRALVKSSSTSGDKSLGRHSPNT